MIGRNSVLIDNWSLESAAILLEYGDLNDVEFRNEEDFFGAFGALANLINSIVFYDEIKFLDNGHQRGWQSVDIFKSKTLSVMKPHILDESEKLVYQNSDTRGADYYLWISQQLDSDVFVSPERSAFLLNAYPQKRINTGKRALGLFNQMDKAIEKEAGNLSDDSIKTGVLENFILPSMLHYVLAEATSKNDLIDVAIDLRNSKEVKSFKQEVQESIIGGNINSITLQNNLIDAIHKQLGKISRSEDKSWQISFTIFFVAIGKAFGLNREKRYLTLLKDITSYRAGINNLNEHIERLFKIRKAH